MISNLYCKRISPVIKRSYQEQVVPVLPGRQGRRREVDPQEPDLVHEVSDDGVHVEEVERDVERPVLGLDVALDELLHQGLDVADAGFVDHDEKVNGLLERPFLAFNWAVVVS